MDTDLDTVDKELEMTGWNTILTTPANYNKLICYWISGTTYYLAEKCSFGTVLTMSAPKNSRPAGKGGLNMIKAANGPWTILVETLWEDFLPWFVPSTTGPTERDFVYEFDSDSKASAF